MSEALAWGELLKAGESTVNCEALRNLLRLPPDHIFIPATGFDSGPYAVDVLSVDADGETCQILVTQHSPLDAADIVWESPGEIAIDAFIVYEDQLEDVDESDFDWPCCNECETDPP